MLRGEIKHPRYTTLILGASVYGTYFIALGNGSNSSSCCHARLSWQRLGTVGTKYVMQIV